MKGALFIGVRKNGDNAIAYFFNETLEFRII